MSVGDTAIIKQRVDFHAVIPELGVYNWDDGMDSIIGKQAVILEYHDCDMVYCRVELLGSHATYIVPARALKIVVSLRKVLSKYKGL